jgi:hypothetical protein
MTDEEILNDYRKGFNLALEGLRLPLPENTSNPLRLGYINAKVGEDVRSVDYFSDAEIIRQVRKMDILEQYLKRPIP